MHARVKSHRKLSRKIGPRKALIKGLVDSLILYERIETTETRAKTIVPVFEKLVTSAKKNTLAGTRQVYSQLSSPIAAEKLTQELVLGFEGRQGGYARIIKIGNRRGDNAPMAIVELVLPEDFDKVVLAARKERAEKSDKTSSKAKATTKNTKTAKDGVKK